jgi:hypothetical protein
VEFLKRRKSQVVQATNPSDPHYKKTRIEIIGDRHSRSGHKFVPLVEKRLGMACALDILFLRRDNPGDLIKNGGDIDNRIKTLFDALRVPQEDEIRGFTPELNEKLFHCLLEDDDLITDVKITTDRLLKPLSPDGCVSDVVLVILVNIKLVGSTSYLREEEFSY